VALVLAALLVSSAAGAGTASVQGLNLNGIGPLTLGMSRTAALKTGWIAHEATGCTLGGKPYPITYTFTGKHAPHGVKGIVQFDHNKLSFMSFNAGVGTITGVILGKTTVSQMVSDYRRAGYSASSKYSTTFAGTFATVKQRGKIVIQGYSPHSKITALGIPAVPTCD
jgi:hypothetical protein